MEQESTVNTSSSKLETARAICKRFSMYSAGVGILPFPIIDFAALTALQLKMLYEISKVYGESFNKNWGKSTIGTLIASISPGALSTGVAASALKSIPLVGGIIGALTFPAFAGASTFALGEVFIRHFDQGGTLLDFDPGLWTNEFQNIFNRKKDGEDEHQEEEVPSEPAPQS